MKAISKNIRISPKKANLVADLIRGKKVNEALNFLRFTPKKAAPLLYKVVTSAAANAENNQKQDRDNLYIKNLLVIKGPTYKRGIPVSRGRWHPILKRTSHISIELAVLEAKASPKKVLKAKPTDKAAKTEPKKETGKNPTMNKPVLNPSKASGAGTKESSSRTEAKQQQQTTKKKK